MNPIEIHPSLLAADFSHLAQDIARVDDAGVHGLHLDIMDGHFVPNISYGPPVIKSIRKCTALPFWAHLMITNPRKYLADYAQAGVQGLVIHVEIEDDLVDLAREIRSLKIIPGISINPETPIQRLIPYLDFYEKVLIMTVHPGFGGQSFMPGPLEKVEFLAEYNRKNKRNIIIEVDGGIDPETAPQAAKAGATALVAGSSIFRKPDIAQAVDELKRSVE